MQKHPMILMLALAICHSCKGIPTLDVKQRIFDYQNSRCVERDYRYSSQYIGPFGSQSEVSIEKCDKLIGFDPETYTEVFEWQEARRRDFQRAVK